MTKREREVFNLIREDPWISQKEIAEKLGITRSSAGVHVLNLTKKGLIRGKRYILNEDEYALVIGGANMDISGFPLKELRWNDSNPGNVRLSMGGVGRNISENLARMGIRVKLLSAVGRDIYGEKIMNDCKALKIDMDAVKQVDEDPTSIYLSIQDSGGDMVLALSDMEISCRIDTEYINRNRGLIEHASVVVIEANLDKRMIEYLFSNFAESCFFVDPVSSAKAERIIGLFEGIDTITCNRHEAEVLCGVRIEKDQDFLDAADKLVRAGIREVFINRGAEGTCYASPEGRGFYRVKRLEMANANGAGDAFIAGLVYGKVNGLSLAEKLEFASAASAVTVSCSETVNPSMSADMIKRYMSSKRNE